MSSRRRRSRRAVKRSLGAGILPRMRPDKSVRARTLVRRCGLTPAAAYGLSALRHPDRPAIIDEIGTLTFGEVHRRTDALAHAFQATGIDDRDTVAIMCRNHRGFIEATIACGKLGADILYLDPAAAPAALAESVRREDPHALIYDEEFSELLRPVGHRRRQFIAWCDPGRDPRYPLLEHLIARHSSASPKEPSKGCECHLMFARPGLAKSAVTQKKRQASLVIPGALLSKLPLRRREATMVAVPMSCAWGFFNFTLSLRLASTLVLRREFDPSDVLAAVSEHEVSVLAVLPEMLRGIVALPETVSACHDTSALRAIVVQGRELASEVAMPAMQRFGDVLYNLRGSTVVRLHGDWVSQTRGTAKPARVVGEHWLKPTASAGFLTRPGT
jgi:acyl-CoA synthetase (AMP-forming)/AMP-acid ligase II